MTLEPNGANSPRSSTQWTKRDRPTGHVRSNVTIEPSSVRFFTGLEKRETSVILAAATRRKLHGGEIVARADDPATHLFLVRDGCVDFYIVTSEGREILLRRLVSGNIFGVSAFLSEPVGYVGTSKAVHNSEVFVWEHTVIRQLAKDYPRLAENASGIPNGTYGSLWSGNKYQECGPGVPCRCQLFFCKPILARVGAQGRRGEEPRKSAHPVP